MKKVIVVYDRPYMEELGDVRVFSNEQNCLNYFKRLYPKAKHLRLRRNDPYDTSHFTLINWTTPILPWYVDIFEAEIDKISD